MADRYQDRPFPADDDHDRGTTLRAVESDPLAELAQADRPGRSVLVPRRAPHPRNPEPMSVQSGHISRSSLPAAVASEDEAPPVGPPSWMQRARQEACRSRTTKSSRQEEYQPSPVHPCAPLRGPAHCGTAHQHRSQRPNIATTCRSLRLADEPDPSRYDDALYGRIEIRRAGLSARSGVSGRPLRLSERLRG